MSLLVAVRVRRDDEGRIVAVIEPAGRQQSGAIVAPGGAWSARAPLARHALRLFAIFNETTTTRPTQLFLPGIGGGL